MKINPYQEHVVLLQYYIDSDMELVAEDATEAYVAYVQDGYLAQAVADNGAYDIEPVYMTELINTAMDMGGLYVNTGNASQNINLSIPESNYEHSVSVKVVGRTEEEALSIAADVKAALSAYAQKLNSAVGIHQLILLEECSVMVVDQTLAELQNRNAVAIKTLTNNLDSMKNEMTSDQISLYVYRTTVLKENETVQSGNVTTIIKTATISVKHAIIGVVVGVILACGLIFALYLFAAALRNGAEVKTLYGVKLLGCVNIAAFEKKKVFAFVDRMITKLQNLNKKELSYEQEIQMVSANIVLDCKKKNCEKVFMTSTVGEVLPKEVINAIVEKCNEKGVQLVSGNAIAYDAEALEELAQVGRVVFVEKKRASLYDELYKEVALCKENDIDVIGMIVLG